MKTVFANHQEVCHIWAQQNQAEGRASRISFDGPSIYSYGRHFEIARFVKPGVVLFTTKDYSVSTSKHKRDVWQAISHLTVYTVPSLEPRHDENLEYYLQKMLRSQKSASTAIKNGAFHFQEMQGYGEQARAYMAEFKADIPASLRSKTEKEIKRILSTDLSKVKAGILAYQKAERARVASERAARDAKYAENLALWKAGYTDIRALPDGMFLRIKGNTVETSHGARVPLPLAVRLYERIKAGEAVHGTPLDNYIVTGFAEGVLTVGCHKIPMAEMERVYQNINGGKIG